MAACETRTITTRGQFHHVNYYLRADVNTDGGLATISLQDEHRVNDPRRYPVECVYHTNCPHQFKLYKRKTATRMSTIAPSLSSNGTQPVEGELAVHLSDSVYEMYSDWNMKWEFGTHSGGSFAANSGEFKAITQVAVTPLSDPLEWKTIVVGQAQSMVARYLANEALAFTVTWSRQEPSPELKSTQRELDELKRAMTQMRTSMFETFNRPSIEITHLVFRSKHSGVFKHLYVPSHVLTQFEYFQRCHSAEYSEAECGHELQREASQTGSLSEGLYGDDSDEEWDSDSENVEPEKDARFKATIHVTDTSRRTYRAFIEYAICGALYFAPLRSAYPQYYITPLGTANLGQFLNKRHASWPEWAKARSTSHTVVPGFKTLSSPKSLYRLADMLIIPQLKAICQKQIVDSLHAGNVISEVQSSVFEQHEELRVEAYKLMRKNWRSYPSKVITPFITNLSPEESSLVFEHILKDLGP